jgi:CheY-like chemotaxis protein
MVAYPKATIIVVDDVPDNLRILMGLLGAQEYEVRAFSEGSFALESARSDPPDLILLDIKMPGMDGFQVCEQLKVVESTRDIPVIFISALHETVDKGKRV